MGVAARDARGPAPAPHRHQIGSLMAWYRAHKFFELGILTPANAGRAVIIKTLVTTDLQAAIAARFGLRCVETLTGFKYIGQKLGKYESALPPSLAADYPSLPEPETRRLRLEYSSFYLFGGEESYGYSGADFVRDKDGNGAAVMFAEVAAYAKSRNLTLPGLLDEIYSDFASTPSKANPSPWKAPKAPPRSSASSTPTLLPPLTLDTVPSPPPPLRPPSASSTPRATPPPPERCS